MDYTGFTVLPDSFRRSCLAISCQYQIVIIMTGKNYNTSLFFLLSHAFLSIVWNLIGLWLLSQGKQALGPTATDAAIVLFLLLSIGYIASSRKGYSIIYLVLACIGAALACYAIIGGLTKDHGLWPSEFWRYAGMAVNVLGVIGFISGVKAFVIERR